MIKIILMAQSTDELSYQARIYGCDDSARELVRRHRAVARLGRRLRDLRLRRSTQPVILEG